MTVSSLARTLWMHRRRKRGGQGGPGPPNNLRGGGQHTLWPPPNNPPICTGKTIPLNSILEFSIISYFQMRNEIIWHWLIKNLMGTRRRNDVDATSLRRIDVVPTSCACWEFGPPKILNLGPPNILNLPTPMEWIPYSLIRWYRIGHSLVESLNQCRNDSIGHSGISLYLLR